MFPLLLAVILGFFAYTTEANAKTYRYCVRVAERLSVTCYDCKNGFMGGEGGRAKCAMNYGPSGEGRGVNVRYGRCSEPRNVSACQR